MTDWKPSADESVRRQAVAPDAVDEAIAASEPRKQTMMATEVTISSTGRKASIAVPVGITGAELTELVGWMCTTLYQASQQAAARQQAAAVIETPRGLHIVPRVS